MWNHLSLMDIYKNNFILNNQKDSFLEMMKNLYANSKRLSIVWNKLQGPHITALTNIYNKNVLQKV